VPRPEPPSAALLIVPPWMWGGEPRRYFGLAQFVARRVRSGHDLCGVKTTERDTGVRASLVIVARYREVADDLRERIVGGEFGIGTLLPPTHLISTTTHRRESALHHVAPLAHP
jgi:hypothetical protein